MNSDFDFNILDGELAEILNIDMTDFGFENINFEVDDYGTDFQLADGDKSEICQITFVLHEQQKELIQYAMSKVKDLTVPIIPFSQIDEFGAGMYKGEKVTRQERHEAA